MKAFLESFCIDCLEISLLLSKHNMYSFTQMTTNIVIKTLLNICITLSVKLPLYVSTSFQYLLSDTQKCILVFYMMSSKIGIILFHLHNTILSNSTKNVYLYVHNSFNVKRWIGERGREARYQNIMS